MKVLNFGSLNLDHFFSVDQIVCEGQSITTRDYEVLPGGKGLNQSLAISRAGTKVYHAGRIGKDGQKLIRVLEDSGVDCSYIAVTDGVTGSAFIQVDQDGRNCIIINGGNNRALTKGQIDKVLGDFSEGDILLLQNETNLVDYLINKAFEKKMEIIFNPSPVDDQIKACDLSKVSLLILNEHEGKAITGFSDDEDILNNLKLKIPSLRILLTTGRRGAKYLGDQYYFQGAIDTKVLDTTGAGDTFTGYYVSSISKEYSIEESLMISAIASSIAISRKGAAPSIPWAEEVMQKKVLHMQGK